MRLVVVSNEVVDAVVEGLVEGILFFLQRLGIFHLLALDVVLLVDEFLLLLACLVLRGVFAVLQVLLEGGCCVFQFAAEAADTLFVALAFGFEGLLRLGEELVVVLQCVEVNVGHFHSILQSSCSGLCGWCFGFFLGFVAGCGQCHYRGGCHKEDSRFLHIINCIIIYL